jgi:hypothetical protein
VSGEGMNYFVESSPSKSITVGVWGTVSGQLLAFEGSKAALRLQVPATVRAILCKFTLHQIEVDLTDLDLAIVPDRGRSVRAQTCPRLEGAATVRASIARIEVWASSAANRDCL